MKAAVRVMFAAVVVVAMMSAAASAVRSNCGCESAGCLPSSPFSITEEPVDNIVRQRLNNMFPEGTSPAASILADTSDPNLYFTKEGTVTLTFYHEGAGYRNAMGYYLFDENNQIIPGSETTIFPDLSFYWPGCMEVGDTVTVGTFPAGTRLGWWIGANAFNGGRNKYYSGVNYQQLNPDQKRHVATVYDDNEKALLVGFEDLFNLGDKDYNDAMFSAVATPDDALDIKVPKLVGNKLQTCSSETSQPTSVVEFAGRRYALLDRGNPEDLSYGCQLEWYRMPSGWSTTTKSAGCYSSIARYPWATTALVVADGSALDTVLLTDLGKTAPGESDELLSTIDGDCLGVLSCDYRMQITQLVGGFSTDLITDLCNAGSASSGAWTMGPNTAVVPNGGRGGCQQFCRSVVDGSSDTALTLSTQGATDLSSGKYKNGFAVGCWAAAELPEDTVESENYSLYADVTFTDGTTESFHKRFPASGDFTYRRLNVFTPGRTISQVFIHTVFRKLSGTACFSDFDVGVPDTNVLLNPSFQERTDSSGDVSTFGWYSLDTEVDTFGLEGSTGFNPSNDPSFVADDVDDFAAICGSGSGASSGTYGYGCQQTYTVPTSSRDRLQAIRFGGYSSCSGVDASAIDEDYSIYVDVEYTDGTWDRSISAPFNTGSHGFELSQKVYPVSTDKTVVRIYVSTLFRDHTGTATFDRVFLDPMYRSGRPAVLGSCYGDPHLVTFDGVAYDMQGVGEYVLARDSSVAAPENSTFSTGFDVQIRTAAAGNDAASIITRVAWRHGCSTVEVAASTTGGLPKLRVMGGEMGQLSVGERVRINSACPGQYSDGSLQLLTKGDAASTSSTDIVVARYLASYPDTGHEVEVTVFRSKFGVQFFQVTTRQPQTSAGRMEGLLGDFNGDGATGDFVGRDGTVYTTRNIWDFSDTWRIDQDESNFHYAKGETVDTFTDLDFKDKVKTLDDFTRAQKDEVAPLCDGAGDAAARDACTFDVLVTGDDSFATTTKVAAQSNGQALSAVGAGSTSSSSRLIASTTAILAIIMLAL